MTTSSRGASAPDASSDGNKLFRLFRDNARPVEFTGAEVASVQLIGDLFETTRAAIYKTVSGKFVAEYAKWVRYATQGQPTQTKGKVESFETLEEAAESFRPGLVTAMLLDKIGDQLKAERID